MTSQACTACGESFPIRQFVIPGRRRKAEAYSPECPMCRGRRRRRDYMRRKAAERGPPQRPGRKPSPQSIARLERRAITAAEPPRPCARCGDIYPFAKFLARRRGRAPELSPYCSRCRDVARRWRTPEAPRAYRKEVTEEEARASKNGHKLLRYRRAASAPRVWTEEDWTRCLEAWNHCCAYCDSRDDLTQDHFIPVASPAFPGTTRANIVPACRSCNSRKGARSPFKWLEDRERLAKIIRYLQRFNTVPHRPIC